VTPRQMQLRQTKKTPQEPRVVARIAGHGYTAEVLDNGQTRYVDDKPEVSHPDPATIAKADGAKWTGTNPIHGATEYWREAGPGYAGFEVATVNENGELGKWICRNRKPEWIGRFRCAA